MKTSVELWVRLKVTDLVTQTAWITFTEKLDFADRLHGIVHYSYWRMGANGADPGSVLKEIDRVIRLDSAFTNQNKHFYRLFSAGLEKWQPPKASEGAVALRRDILSAGDLPLEKDFALSSGGASRGENLFAFDCLVREKRPDREIGFAERLNSRLRGVIVSDMKYGEVWRLIVGAASSGAALGDIEGMLVSRSRREGLLLNPHYQQYEIISTTRLGGAASKAPTKE